MHPLITAIREHARQHPAKAALRWRCNDYPYAALEAMIDARARALQLKGIRAGDTVAFDAAACLDAIVDTAALWTLGASAAPFSAGAAGRPAGKAIRSGAAGFMHRGGNYIKTIAQKVPASSTNATNTASLMLPPDSTCSTGSATCLHDEAFHDLHQWTEEKFTLSARTVLGLSTIDQRHSLLDVWAPLAAGSTVDLLPDHEALQSASLLQHFSETEADLVLAAPAFYRRIATAREALFPQFRDVIITGDADSHTRSAMADAFPCAIFHLTDGLAGQGSMRDYRSGEFTSGTTLSKR